MWFDEIELCAQNIDRELRGSMLTEKENHLHLNSDSEILNDSGCDLQLLTGLYNSRSDEMAKIKCKVGSA